MDMAESRLTDGNQHSDVRGGLRSTISEARPETRLLAERKSATRFCISGLPWAGSYPEPKLLLDAFNSDEIAVMICAGAKGFCTSTLFGTPCEGQSSI